MMFEPKFGLGVLFDILITVGGFVVMWATARERLNQLWKRTEAQEKQHEENKAELNDIKLQIARDCVKVDDFRRFDERLDAKFDKIDHSIKNAFTTTFGMVKDLLRDMPANRGLREPSHREPRG